ncbi:LLM class flavin-dependent oxidoreductase [Gordonia soli]|uniref:Putative oxidoreductase n=1 Tax=Gordonia soli NBRC 108243 TaxID=1223545 RepID=M0QN34_9ACTN|nr:LLM class flavin-dependent oxidoreductase [Gordonia soli]GAC70075.1 putative oxidoreductase [Gordonia soli NBRC 108243]
MSDGQSRHLAIGLSGTGRHPAAWREPGARPTEVVRAQRWIDLVSRAGEAGADLVTLDDSFGAHPGLTTATDDRTDLLTGRVDAVLLASRVAPAVPGIGIVPTAVTTHTEPFHTSKAIATLDYVSTGRAGVELSIATSAADAALFGRREIAGDDSGTVELLAEAEDYAEVLRRLWDSWEDDAEIRDVATGRFVDRDRLHYIDFDGPRFSVRGPSITPRPPQGQPLIVAAADHGARSAELIGRVADVGFVPATDATAARASVDAIRSAQSAAGRTEETVHVFADLIVVLDADVATAAARLARLDEAAGIGIPRSAPVFVGTPADLVDHITELVGGTGVTGVRLQPATIPHDLDLIVAEVAPELQRRSGFGRAVTPVDGWSGTLRGRLGLPRPTNRYGTRTTSTAQAGVR